MVACSFRDPIEWEATLPVRPSSPAWRATIKALYGSPLDDEEQALFRELSGGREPPEGGALEFLAVVGRRGGKSETISRVAVFEAVHGGHAIALAPGQTGLIPVISPLREQSKEILGYVRGLAALPQVKRYVAAETADSVTFRTGVAVRVMTADAIALSGPTVVTAIRDEWAKFPGLEAAMPDTEIDNSLRPALAPVEGAPPRRLIGITSAYIREGLAYDTDRLNFGRDDADVLVVRGASNLFNPNLAKDWLERERRKDPRIFAREYLAEWQDAVTEGWFGADVVDRCIDRGRERSAPESGHVYEAAIDAAFRGDQFALAIAHRETAGTGPARVVVDGVWVWKSPRGEPLDVEATVAESAAIVREYGADNLIADQFAFDPLREAYARHGVYLTQMPWTATTKPQRFGQVRAGMTSRLVRLPEDPALIREFHGIQGRLLRSGGEQIEAKGGGKDDRVFAVVLVVSATMERQPDWNERPRDTDGESTHDPIEAEAAEWIRKLERRSEREAFIARNGFDFPGLDPADLPLPRWLQSRRDTFN